MSVSAINAQDTKGTDFWLTFGRNSNKIYNEVDLQIRIVGGDVKTHVILEFTGLSAPNDEFDVSPQQVYTYPLSPAQKQAVYNEIADKSNKSIHVTSDNAITAYAVNLCESTTDATNILPITALGTEYYHISYTPLSTRLDAYAVVATENDTEIFYNGSKVETLNTGQVYYYTSSSDMTGAHITSTPDKPIAFFAVTQGAQIPAGYVSIDCLFQQLAPVHTWGYNFFVPVSHLGKDIVRIVASKDNTKIDQWGGTMLYPTGGQTGYIIDAGQFIELEVSLANDGCYIEADKPIGVCTYLTSIQYTGLGISDPSQAWLPAIEQTAPNALIAPFISAGSVINQHYAIVMAPAGAALNTEVSIGGGTPISLLGETWYNNSDAKMSFCHI